jgi:hypothetical protein
MLQQRYYTLSHFKVLGTLVLKQKIHGQIFEIPNYFYIKNLRIEFMNISL